ncbi:alpha-galactosidase, partial [Vibrio cholerae O1 biovar El Tor]|nr:alpha-galactosidase [Vibrio cholerae O1 biovar El Tor]
LFGHFGIEGDLAEASEQELAELGAWIDVYRDLRELLHTGDTVRIDAPGDGVLVHGVVSPDRDDALFAYVVHDFGLEDPSP